MPEGAALVLRIDRHLGGGAPVVRTRTIATREVLRQRLEGITRETSTREKARIVGEFTDRMRRTENAAWLDALSADPEAAALVGAELVQALASGR